MSVYLGFDPGGKNAFGWCVAEGPIGLPLRIVSHGTVSHAAAAVQATLNAVTDHAHIAAVGIDSPMFWTTHGPREVDKILRDALKTTPAPSPGGTVQQVNSLRGACLVQGILVALLLREQLPGIPITECHPKAWMWLQEGSVDAIPRVPSFEWSDTADLTDHERDAAVAALSAWAMHNSATGWCDLIAHESPYYSPVKPPLAYWMPQLP